MKFIKIICRNTNKEMDDITDNLDRISCDIFTKICEKFKYIECDIEENHNVMYAAIEEKELENLLFVYIRNGVKFSYEEITKSVLFGIIPEIIGEQEKLNLKSLVENFIENNLNVDTVLDKINEDGIHSLSEMDKRVLQSF